MKRKLSLSLLMLITLSAGAVDEELCRDEIKFVGGRNNVPVHCFDVKGENENAYNYRIRPDLNLEMKALGEIVFLKNTKTNLISRIAGDKTKLTEVLSLDIDSQKNILYILNRNHEGELEILAFKSNWQGNVHPLKVMTNNHLPKNIKQIVFDLRNSNVLALDASGKKVYSILPGDSLHSNSENHPSVSHEITLSPPASYIHSTQEGIAVVNRHGEWKWFRDINNQKAIASDLADSSPVRMPASIPE